MQLDGHPGCWRDDEMMRDAVDGWTFIAAAEDQFCKAIQRDSLIRGDQRAWIDVQTEGEFEILKNWDLDKRVQEGLEQKRLVDALTLVKQTDAQTRQFGIQYFRKVIYRQWVLPIVG